MKTTSRSKRRLDAWGRLCSAFQLSPGEQMADTYLKRLDLFDDRCVVTAIVEAIDSCDAFPKVSLLIELAKKARREAGQKQVAVDCDACHGRGIIYAFRPYWSGELVVRDGYIRRKVEKQNRDDGVPSHWSLCGLRCQCAAGRYKIAQSTMEYAPIRVRSLGWALEDQALAARDNVPDMRLDVERYKLHCECAVGTKWGQDVEHPAVAPVPPVEDYDVSF